MGAEGGALVTLMGLAVIPKRCFTPAARACLTSCAMGWFLEQWCTSSMIREEV